MRRQRNMAQMKEQNKTAEKELNERNSQPLRCRAQNTGYQDAQRSHVTQAEMKVALSEIKKNLQGTTVEWIKLKIKSMMWIIRKPKQPNRTR